MKLYQHIRRSLLTVTLSLFMAMTLNACGDKTPKEAAFALETNDDGSILVKANHAKAGSGSLGYLTIEQGQSMGVDAKLDGDQSLRIQAAVGSGDDIENPPIDAVKGSENSDTEYVLDETVSGTDMYTFHLEPASYLILVTATGKVNGTVRIFPEGEATAGTAGSDKETDSKDAAGPD